MVKEVVKEVYVVLYKSIHDVETSIDKIYTKPEKAKTYVDKMNQRCNKAGVNLEFYMQPEKLVVI